MAAARDVLHRLFETSIFLKGVLAAFETLTGILLATPLSGRALRYLHESHDDGIFSPDDLLARPILAHLQAFDSASLHFWAAYLIGHGAVKLAVVGALLWEWRSAWPLAMAVLGGFILWQMREWQHSGNPVMLALSAFDLFIIWLTWREWKGRTA
ncbi:MAG TPA: DUF2127 domain-containing protein [Paracoccus sp. (in: a-proteobacteria)]|nr:DUF2127 domain-containing protein [Paracoccus sp. (in: a-proteobacteria)]